MLTIALAAENSSLLVRPDVIKHTLHSENTATNIWNKSARMNLPLVSRSCKKYPQSTHRSKCSRGTCPRLR